MPGRQREATGKRKRYHEGETKRVENHSEKKAGKKELPTKDITHAKMREGKRRTS